jgi:cell division protein FtsB
MTTEKNTTANTAEPKKEQAQINKNLSGAEQPAEQSVWEKAAETIAGDNKMLASVLKMLLSPLALLAGAGLLVYCFLEMRKQKVEIEKLKNDNKELAQENEKTKKKYKKWKALSEGEATKEVSGLGFTQQQSLPIASDKKKTYQTNYLD